MKAKRIITIVLFLALLLAVASACYSLGYRSRALRDFEMGEARGRLGINLQIYEEAQRGDLQAVRGHLGLVILGQTRVYEQTYGAPIGADPFAQKFARAQDIASQIESNLVPVSSILTNPPPSPDAKVTSKSK